MANSVHRWTSEKVKTHTRRVYIYIKRKLRYNRKKYAKRPLKIQITWVRKACKLTYDEARYALNCLVYDGLIEKWTVFDRPRHRTSYYRLPVNKPVDKS